MVFLGSVIKTSACEFTQPVAAPKVWLGPPLKSVTEFFLFLTMLEPRSAVVNAIIGKEKVEVELCTITFQVETPKITTRVVMLRSLGSTTRPTYSGVGSKPQLL